MYAVQEEIVLNEKAFTTLLKTSKASFVKFEIIAFLLPSIQEVFL